MLQVKIYAELIGNYKKQRIKSLYDNIIVQELGTRNTPKIGAIYNSVADNIPMIIKIQSQYLSGMNNMEAAQSQIDEGEEQGE